MKGFTRNLGRCWRWVRRFRHRRGYGIHSPFAFNLVTRVVYEEGEFYAYAPLSEQRKRRGGVAEKDDRLMLRLINDHRPRTCLVVGSGCGLTLRYLENGCSSCRFVWLKSFSEEAFARAVAQLGHLDMLYADAENWTAAFAAALPHATDRTLLVAQGIRCTRADREAWRSICAAEAVTVSFDLHRLGLAYCDKNLNRQSYVINYF